MRSDRAIATRQAVQLGAGRLLLRAGASSDRTLQSPHDAEQRAASAPHTSAEGAARPTGSVPPHRGRRLAFIRTETAPHPARLEDARDVDGRPADTPDRCDRAVSATQQSATRDAEVCSARQVAEATVCRHSPRALGPSRASIESPNRLERVAGDVSSFPAPSTATRSVERDRFIAAAAARPLGQLSHYIGGNTDERILDVAGGDAAPLVLRVQSEAVGGGEGLELQHGTYRYTVHDGHRTFTASSAELAPLHASETDAERILAHARASPSPRCAADPSDRWAWLSPAGLAAAARRSIEVTRASVPHLVGRRGRGIRAVEDKLGLIMGLIDEPGGVATVTLIGPNAKLAVGEAVVRALALGARSVLHRIDMMV